MTDNGYKTTNIVGQGITTLGAFAAVTPLNFNNNNTISLNTVPVGKGGTGLTAVGGAGTALVSNGSAMTWQAISGLSGGTVTSVGISVPSFLSVSNTPVTLSGTIAISATSTGTGSVVLQTSPTLTTPNIGAATGSSLTLSGLTASTLLTTDGSKQLTSLPTGLNNQVLTVSGTTLTWANPASAVTSVGISVPSFMSVSNTPIIDSGTIAISATSTGAGSVVLQTSPSLTTPDIGAATGSSLTLSGLTASTLLTTNGSKQLTSQALGTNNQVLTSTGSGLTWTTPTTGNLFLNPQELLLL